MSFFKYYIVKVMSEKVQANLLVMPTATMVANFLVFAYKIAATIINFREGNPYLLKVPIHLGRLIVTNARTPF